MDKKSNENRKIFIKSKKLPQEKGESHFAVYIWS